MPTFHAGDAELYYEVHGDGFPILLIAPGGMRSEMTFWERTPWNPVTQLADRYRVITMDQRNAGRSTAPVGAGDGWHTYTADQLALLDHLPADLRLAVNVSPATALDPRLLAMVSDAPSDRITLEVTEHDAVAQDDTVAEHNAIARYYQ